MIFAVAFVVTALLGTAEGAYQGLTPTQALLLGIVSGAVPAGVAAFLNRKKTRVDVAGELIKASSELVGAYRTHDADMEARVAAAESNARLALSAEGECRRRLSELEARLNAPVTTTVQVTHQPTAGD